MKIRDNCFLAMACVIATLVYYLNRLKKEWTGKPEKAKCL